MHLNGASSTFGLCIQLVTGNGTLLISADERLVITEAQSPSRTRRVAQDRIFTRLSTAHRIFGGMHESSGEFEALQVTLSCDIQSK